jgi:hypothetical protein
MVHCRDTDAICNLLFDICGEIKKLEREKTLTKKIKDVFTRVS